MTFGELIMKLSTSHIRVFVQNYGMKTVKIAVCVLAALFMQTTAIAQVGGNQQNQIIALHSNKCVDVSDISTANGQAVQQWQCFPQNANQNWDFEAKGRGYLLKARHSGKCLDVKDFQTTNGAPIIQWDCHGSDNQLWTVNELGGGYQIKSVQSGKCLDVRGPSVENGAQMQIWDCVGPSQTNQLFKISNLSSASALPAVPAGRSTSTLGAAVSSSAAAAAAAGAAAGGAIAAAPTTSANTATSQVVKLRFLNASPRDMDIYFNDENGETRYLATVQSGYQLTQPSPVGVRWHVAQDDQWKETYETTSESLQVIRFGD